MSAGINDKFRHGAAAFSTTLASDKAAAAASCSLSSASGVLTTTAMDITVGRVDSSGTRTPTKKAVYKGTLSGTTLSNLTLVEGTDQLHVAGTVVEITFTAATHNDMVDGILVEHTQAGLHTLTSSSTITSAKHITDISDTNGNELFKLTATSSAVNEVTVANAATGNNPSLTASGGDTNVGLNLVSKGTGEIQVNGVSMSGAYTTFSPTWTNLTVGNGTVVAKYKQIGKTVSGRVSVVFGSTSSISGDVSFTLPVTAATHAGSSNLAPLGMVHFFDTSASLIIFGFVTYGSTTTGVVRASKVDTVTGGVQALSSTQPFAATWATGDEISLTFSYEAA